MGQRDGIAFAVPPRTEPEPLERARPSSRQEVFAATLSPETKSVLAPSQRVVAGVTEEVVSKTRAGKSLRPCLVNSVLCVWFACVLFVSFFLWSWGMSFFACVLRSPRTPAASRPFPFPASCSSIATKANVSQPTQSCRLYACLPVSTSTLTLCLPTALPAGDS